MKRSIIRFHQLMKDIQWKLQRLLQLVIQKEEEENLKLMMILFFFFFLAEINETLVFQLQRFKYDFGSGYIMKIGNYYIIMMMDDILIITITQKKKLADFVEFPTIFKGKEELFRHGANEEVNSKIETLTYELVCVIAHSFHDGYTFFLHKEGKVYKSCHQDDHDATGQMNLFSGQISDLYQGEEVGYLLFYKKSSSARKSILSPKKNQSNKEVNEKTNLIEQQKVAKEATRRVAGKTLGKTANAAVEAAASKR